MRIITMGTFGMVMGLLGAGAALVADALFVATGSKSQSKPSSKCRKDTEKENDTQDS